MLRSFALACALLWATPLNALTPDVLRNDVRSLRDAGLNEKKSAKVAEVATQIATRVATDLFQTENLLDRIERLEVAIGVDDEETQIQALKANKISKPDKTGIGVGATVVIALTAVTTPYC
jgi:hypothetical protein